MPLVSVVMPVYNAEAFLDDAVESVLSQTFTDFELLAFDDGSSDSSAAILRAKMQKDPRVRLLGGEHRGLTHWLNEGIRLAQGSFVARMDADDICLPERLQRQVDHMQAHADCCLVGTQAFQIDPDGWPIGRWEVPRTHAEIDGQHIAGRPGGIIHPSALIRKSALEEVRGYRQETELAEDYDLFMRLAETGRVANLDQYLLKYRLHEKSLTASRSAEQYKVTCAALNDAWKRRGLAGEAPEATCGKTAPRHEDFLYQWSYSALSERHFKTALKYSRRLVVARPGASAAWMLLIASALGPVAFALRNLIPFRPSRIR